MKIALLRVGIDTGCGGIHGPLFKNGSFEYIPIPDGFGIDQLTYGNATGTNGKPLISYFPKSRQSKMMGQSIHFDPEFSSFTYGDPSSPKASLRRLTPGDILIFYCGLEGWDLNSKPALYIVGFFEVLRAGKAADFDSQEIKRLFGKNFHVRHKMIFQRQKENLVLVKGSNNSRLLKKAVLLSADGQDRSGRPLKVISDEMQKVFGNFNGKISFQRSPTRWVHPDFAPKANAFINSLD